jgi:hypothetical protein
MNKADWANNLTLDPNWQELMSELRSVELAKFTNSDYHDVEAREQAYIRLRTLESITDYLEGLKAQKAIDKKRWKIL